MILDIADLVARHCGVSADTARDLRVAFIKTTDPIFLVFATHQDHPLFVVKIGDAAELERRSVWKARLYDLLPDAIARPFGVFRLDHGRGMLVQNGLPGQPWFRLVDRLSTPRDWLLLRRRAVDQLRAFQAAVSSQADWVVPEARFDDDLRSLATGLADLLDPLGPPARAMLADAASTLGGLGPVPATWQHGDFVLNNLLVDDRRLGVLDLVDFGKWRVPLLDAFALGSSIQFHASNHVPWHHLADDLAACAAAAPEAAAFTSRQKTAFFAYFLLAAISDTLQRPSRATIRLTYLEHLRDLVDNPLRYVRAFDAPP